MFNRAWLAGGIPRTACVAAYEPICAVSLADSYINRANPGTYDAAPGTAPTWAAQTGWTFNGTTQYLLADIAANIGWSVLVRYSGATDLGAPKIIFGSQSAGGGTVRFHIQPSQSNIIYYSHEDSVGVAPGLLAGVLGIAGQQGFRNGVSDGGVIPSGGTGTRPTKVAIGALYEGAGAVFYCNANIQALYIYNVPITPTQVRAVTDAMNMLPMRPQLPRFRSWLTGGAVTQFRKLLGLRTGSRGVPE